MSETTAEERRWEKRLEGEGRMSGKVWADAAEELASWKEVFVGYFGPGAADLLVADKAIQDAGYTDIGKLQGELEQAEAQRDKAVGRFILAVNAEAEADMKRGNPLEGAHHRALEKLGAPFLAGLSTTEGLLIEKGTGHPEERAPEYQPCERVRARAHTPGDLASHICKRHLCPWSVEGECPAAEDQPCERVFAGYGIAGMGYKCATHHAPWPSDMQRCPAAMAGNVTT